MSQVATIQPQQRAPSKVEVFLSRVLTTEDRAQLKAALPKHIPFERFERNLSNALMNEPRLLECNPREVFREVAKIAAIGLLIDSQLGEAYLIASSKGPQARIGYRGLVKLARQSGEVAMVYAHEVYSNDEIECLLGDEKKLTHKPVLFGDRGEVIGYYAVIKYKDGETDFEPMTPEQINTIRDKSDGYKAYKAGKIKDTPWASSYGEMAKKTCIRRLMKRSPQSPDLAAAINIEDTAEHSYLPERDVSEIASVSRPRTIMGKLDDLASDHREASDLEDIPDGEVLTPDDASLPIEAATEHQATVPAEAEAKASKEPGDYTDQIAMLSDAFENAATEEELLQLAEDAAEAWFNAAPKKIREQAEDIFEKHRERLRGVEQAPEQKPEVDSDKKRIYADGMAEARKGGRRLSAWLSKLDPKTSKIVDEFIEELNDVAAQSDGTRS